MTFMNEPIPGDYDPWKEVIILWDRGVTTRQLVRRSEIAGWLGTLPIESIVMFAFGNPKDSEEPKSGTKG